MSLHHFGDDESDLVNLLVITEKPDGRPYTCLNPKECNKKEHQPVPRVEDITPRLCGAIQFPKLDATHGYWNVPPAKESQALTTLNTHKGMYKLLSSLWFKNVPTYVPGKD